MKAEQRKELETNTLADKMGQTMQRVKAGSRRTALIYFIGMLALALVLFIGYRYYSISKQEASEQWLKLYDASPGYLRYLSAKEGETPAGKAARLQTLWIFFWEQGVKRLGTDQRGTMELFKILDREYKDLAETCKDDPLFEAQALLGQAVVVECWAVQDRVHLDKSKRLYEELADKHPTLAEGKFARERFDLMKDARKAAELRSIYEELQLLLMVPLPERAPVAPIGPLDIEPKLDPKVDAPK
jgi:hypothetical protein